MPSLYCASCCASRCAVAAKFCFWARLWGFTWHSHEDDAPFILQLLDVPESIAYTLKSFRAGQSR
eukprot:3874282-Amphidinium_carterae.1